MNPIAYSISQEHKHSQLNWFGNREYGVSEYCQHTNERYSCQNTLERVIGVAFQGAQMNHLI